MSSNEIKVRNYFENHFGVLILIIITAPFIIIPVLSFLLIKGMQFYNFLYEGQFIMMEIDTSKAITSSEFVYYYTCMLSIEVSFLFSYAIYLLTKQSSFKENYDWKMNKAITLNKISNELYDNYETYLKKQFHFNAVSLCEMIESKDKKYNNFNYKNKITFSTEMWKRNKAYFELLIRDNNDIYIKIYQVYSDLEYIENNKQLSKEIVSRMAELRTNIKVCLNTIELMISDIIDNG